MRISDWSSDVCSSDLVQQFDARITKKQIRAPFAGELGIRRVNLGQYLNPGDPVATLTALDRLFVDFTLPQQDLAKLHVGAQIGSAHVCISVTNAHLVCRLLLEKQKKQYNNITFTHT